MSDKDIHGGEVSGFGASPASEAIKTARRITARVKALCAERPTALNGYRLKLWEEVEAEIAQALLASQHPPSAANVTDEQEALETAYAEQSSNRRTNELDFSAGWESAIEWVKNTAAQFLRGAAEVERVGQVTTREVVAPGQPGPSCDPADICAGCRCRYNTYGENDSLGTKGGPA